MYINLDHERSTSYHAFILSSHQIFKSSSSSLSTPTQIVNSILLRNSRCEQIIKVQRTHKRPIPGTFLIRNRLGITRATFRNDFPLATFVAKCLRNLTAQRASFRPFFQASHRFGRKSFVLDRIELCFESKLNMDTSNIGVTRDSLCR